MTSVHWRRVYSCGHIDQCRCFGEKRTTRYDFECHSCREQRRRRAEDSKRGEATKEAMAAELRNGYLPISALGSGGVITVAQVGLLEQAIERARANGEHAGFSIGGAWVTVRPLDVVKGHDEQQDGPAYVGRRLMEARYPVPLAQPQRDKPYDAGTRRS